MLIEHPSQLNERAAARAAVIRTDEANRIEGFRVVMGADEIEFLALRLVRPARDQVNELNRSARSLGGEGLVDDLPTGCLQLLVNVSARLFDRVRFRRARTEIDQRLHMRERFFAGKFLPRFPVRDGRFAAGQAEDGEPDDAQEKRSLREPPLVR